MLRGRNGVKRLGSRSHVLEPEGKSPERASAVFSSLPPRLREGTFAVDATRVLPRAFEVPVPHDPTALQGVGLRIPYSELPATISNLNQWEHVFRRSGASLEFKHGYFEIRASGSATDPIDHPLCNRLERLTALMLFNTASLPVVLPSSESIQSVAAVHPPFHSVNDWKHGLSRVVRSYAEALYGERAFTQTQVSAAIKIPSRIEPAQVIRDSTDQLCRYAERNGIVLKVEDDIRVDQSTGTPIPHLLGSTITVRVMLNAENRDQQIQKLLDFANRVAARCFQEDVIWEGKADAVALGTIPSLDMPPFPLWCTQAPVQLFWHLPFAAQIRTPVFNEDEKRAWVVVPKLPQADHVEPQRIMLARRWGVDYYTRTEYGHETSCFSVNFTENNRGRSRSILKLLGCLDACFGDPGQRRGAGSDPFEGV